MMSKWSEIRAIKFLDIYEKHECLWNNQLESYKDRTAKCAALDAILKELNMPDLTQNDIKLKIKSIRTTYKRELTAVLKSNKNNKMRSYTPKLFWFTRADRFLRAVSGRRGMHGKKEAEEIYEETVIGEADDSFNDNAQEEMSSGHKCKSERIVESSEMNDNSHQTEHTQVICESNGHGETIVENSITFTPYHHENNEQHHYINRQHQTVTVPETTSTATTSTKGNDDDEFALFCRSVAAQLRAIPDAYSRSVAKFKIQQILFEAETGHYKKSTLITIPSTQTLHS